MRKLIMLAIFIACAAPFTFAQTDYNKVEFYGGFSHNRVDTGISNNDPEFDDIIDEREGFNGFNTSITGNVSRYVGIKGDYAFHRKTFDVTTGIAGVPTFGVRSDLHNLLGGVQIKDNSKETKVKPFAHFMAGVAHATFDVTNVPAALGTFDDSETGFAAAIGGGIDFRVSPRVDIRAFQFDYNPTRLGDETQHNFRVGVGIVIH